MSTATKRPHALALADATAFRALFPAECYARWEIAGSVRRRKPDVGDVEHVVMPRTGDVNRGGLFPEPANLLWRRLDELVADGTLLKHIYGGTGYRWGERYRGVEFRGCLHELWTADADNWGSILTIRTGPAEFSQRLVTVMRDHGLRQAKGYVWSCRLCPHCDRGDGSCKVCDDTKLEPVDRLSVADEREFFRLCGVAWREPEERA